MIGLVYNDETRLDISIQLIRSVLERMGRTGWTIEASTDTITSFRGIPRP